MNAPFALLAVSGLGSVMMLVASLWLARYANRMVQEGADLRSRVRELEAENKRLRSEKDYNYYERSVIVALLVRTCAQQGMLVGAGYDSKFSPRWAYSAYIDHPDVGQVCWHFREDHAWMLANLPKYPKRWDGRSTALRYKAIESFLRS